MTANWQRHLIEAAIKSMHAAILLFTYAKQPEMAGTAEHDTLEA